MTQSRPWRSTGAARAAATRRAAPPRPAGHLGFALALAAEPEPAWDTRPFSPAPPRADPAPHLGINPIPV